MLSCRSLNFQANAPDVEQYNNEFKLLVKEI